MSSEDFSKLSWDTEFFGFPIARLSLKDMERFEAVKADARKDKIRLLYWSCCANSELSERAKKEVAGFVGDQVIFEKKLGSEQRVKLPDGFVAQPYLAQEPDDELIDLSLAAGWSSRYRVDEKFSADDFRRLYLAWIENSCNGKFADVVMLVCDQSGKKAGFTTVSIKGAEAKIGLLSVSPDFRRLGIGSALVQIADDFAIKQGCSQIQVATQAENLGAVGLYQRQGYLPRETSSFFHVWLD